jgi:hypothetical protein
MVTNGPNTSYDDAILRLNRKSLRNALTTASFLSALEYAGHSSSPLFPCLNFEKTRLLAEAVIKSGAAWYKGEPVKASDLPVLLNGAVNASDDRRIDEITSGRPREEILYDLQKFFSRLGYIQLRPQQNQGISIGQLLAVAERLPCDNWQDLPLEIQNVAKSFRDTVVGVLGESPTALIQVATALLNALKTIGSHFLTLIPAPPASVQQNWQAAELTKLLDHASGHLDGLVISRTSFETLIRNVGLSANLDAFLGIFASPIRDLRNLSKLQEFNVGPEALRLSPLDRFPLVLDESGAAFIPNARVFCASLSSILHFTLNERCRDEYQKIRGHILELYFRKLLAKRAPNLIVLPEKKWGKQNVAGPDLTIIDHGSHPVVIGVEIKSRRMLPNTRFELRDDDIKNNYEDLWKALTKLNDKLDQVLAGSGEYQEFKSDLDRARNYPRKLLGIAGEAPFMFAELATALSNMDSTFPLHTLSSDWSVMSAETFERFIEAAVQHGRSIREALDEYRLDSLNLEINAPMAEHFRKREIDLSLSYAASFVP